MKTLYAEKKYFCDFMFDDMGLKEYVNEAKAYDIDVWISCEDYLKYPLRFFIYIHLYKITRVVI